MRVVIAGASGLLGQHLSAELVGRGHAVIALVRRPTSSPDESSWDPQAGEVDDAVIASADVVVNLAGAPMAGLPYSSRWQRAMRESRVTSTRVLAEAVARAERPPALLAQNGSSFYGDHGDEVVTEESDSRGDAFLTVLTRDWQAAAEPAVGAGARVCVMRTAPVADRANPLLKLQVPVFKAFLGARLGNGRQYFPVISLHDWVGAAVHLLEHPSASGVFNMCAPRTPTNEEYTQAFAHAVSRRAFLAVPAPVLKLAAGPMAPEMLNSINLRPTALDGAGYRFRDDTVERIVAAALAH
jgi:uncharacterized protein (TIGR01777 family)